MLGHGKGYYNYKPMLQYDRRIHQMSGKGIRQPQRMPMMQCGGKSYHKESLIGLLNTKWQNDLRAFNRLSPEKKRIFFKKLSKRVNYNYKGWEVFKYQELSPILKSDIKENIDILNEIKGGKLPDEDKQFYQSLWNRNKGKFYRGTADGKGLGFGVMGEGQYVAYNKSMAQAFAKISTEQSKGKPKVEEVKLPKDLKLLNYKSPTMFKIKESLGVGKWDNVADPMYSKILTEKVKKLGFDGVISDDVSEGIVIFNK